MEMSLRKMARSIGPLRNAVLRYRVYREEATARRVFRNADVYFDALKAKSDGLRTLETRDGLKIRIRGNIWDARIVREMYVRRDYLQHIILPAAPVVIDIGGYIGDFTIYAAKYLNARVYVFEPTAENYALLLENVAINGLQDRITAFNAAVSNAGSITLNVQKQEEGEIHVSAHRYGESEKRVVPAYLPERILADNGLEHVDLLKIDCEGGEYEIFPLLTPAILARIGNVVFEYHKFIPDWQPRVERLFKQLQDAGFRIRTEGNIVSASRQEALAMPAGS